MGAEPELSVWSVECPWVPLYADHQTMLTDVAFYGSHDGGPCCREDGDALIVISPAGRRNDRQGSLPARVGLGTLPARTTGVATWVLPGARR